MSGGVLHIHAPQPTDRHVAAGTCPDCKRRTRFISTFTPWYGSHTTCLRCGRNWQDGEWIPLEFERGVRQRSIVSAKRRFRRVVQAEPSEAATISASDPG